MTQKLDQILRIDGIDINLSEASAEISESVARLKQIAKVLEEQNNMLAVLTKAKNAYISDLKAEITKQKTGLDFASFFDSE
jgi:predicted  nucleic acid-binding Zn-ribbon protein